MFSSKTQKNNTIYQGSARKGSGFRKDTVSQLKHANSKDDGSNKDTSPNMDKKENPPKVQYLEVEQERAGQRIDNFLITTLKGLPKTRVYRILRKGEVRVNKARVKPDYRVQSGDAIRVPPLRLSEKIENKSQRVPATLIKNLLNKIIYEDSEMLILNKPAGVAVHGGSGLDFGVIEVLRAIKPENKNWELVHRLDRDTSGCVMIAKKRSALKFLQAQLTTGKIEKKYIGLIQGHLDQDIKIDAPLMKNQLSSGERIVKVHKEGKASETAVKILKRYKTAQAKTTLVELKLITGRTHQIRVHCQHIEKPLAGDPKYGTEHFNKVMKKYGLRRLFLHASQLRFVLPKTLQAISIQAPLDAELQSCLTKMV